ncbi:MAG: sigma 54-interacting transcriptional regulator [Elusimicrobia bacterium]|nr:sigma 54-interacting transcriptional regulator [Elusimicrobiota bacterium]
MPAKILIVDDEELIRWSLCEDLAASGYKTVAAEDEASAVEALEREAPDAVLTDLRLGRGSGLEVLKAARRANPGLPVVIMTGFADFSTAVEAMREGAADYIAKPLQLAGLKITLQRVLETARLRSRLENATQKRRDRNSFEGVVAESPSMREALAMARKIAASPQGTVLILGESGVGKDRMARAIHFGSLRADRPFMEITCTALPENLLESELFGHERGSFTGAAERKRGLFELADGGAVFLNEIGHMPAVLQAKILRVLEDKAFRRVGGKEDLTVDVRIMAATNEDLEKAVAERRFREDLYYRINVLAIRLKPLRDRPEDIGPLADLLMDRLARELGRPKPGLPAKTVADMKAYPWPGNVRELRNVLERMMILGETDFQPIAPPRPAPAQPAAFALPEQGVSLDEVERRLVEQAISRSAGNQVKAAQLLGISRDALRRRLEKFGLAAGLALALGLRSLPASAGFFGGKDKDAGAKDPVALALPDKAKELKGKPNAHAPVKEGACSKCHADAKAPAKLVLEYKSLCLSCHKKVEEDSKKSSVHSPVNDGDCSTCHAPHDSDKPALLNAAVNDLCGQCHTAGDDPLKKAHHGITAIAAACTSCHQPHGSGRPKLLIDAKEHVPFASRSCEMCHEPAGKDGKAVLKEMPAKSCFVCHPDFKKLLDKPATHMPFANGQCADCHNPHVSARPGMIKGRLDAICLGCHDAGLKDNHPVARHPTSREGKADPRRPGRPFDCASCHEPHAGTLPKLARGEPERLCGECHQK